jgi:hypothetical protein
MRGAAARGETQLEVLEQSSDLLLVFASTAVLCSGSVGARDHIFFVLRPVIVLKLNLLFDEGTAESSIF